MQDSKRRARYRLPFSAHTGKFQIALVLILIIVGLKLLPSPEIVSTAQGNAAQDPSELRAEATTWIFDHQSRRGRRAADLARSGYKTSGPKQSDAINTTAVDDSAGQLFTRGPTGYTPAQMRRAYGFDELDNDGRGQTIAIVSAFDYPTAAADLKKFITTFKLKKMYGLPGRQPCTVALGPHPCFEVVYARGTRPPLIEGWALESALDTQWAHAIAPGADIFLVLASTNTFVDLFQAVQVATNLGSSIVSMSWGGPEFVGQSIFEPLFMISGVTFLAASGDSGTGLFYPAASPLVISVGGTTLRLDKKGNRVGRETAWSFSGGGISQFFAEPAYQATYPIPETFGHRGNPDVSYNADPLTAVSVYTSTGVQGQTGWFNAGGTSASAPQWAGLIALANQLRSNGNLTSSNESNSPLYDAARRDFEDNYVDIRSGTNGSCGPVCTAVRGYDFVTGLGSPKAEELVKELAGRNRR